ncbi:MAG: M20/M25/M40 family metallo-hydrolase [Patescibacteria group bacterium]|jgi:succinyl-diaminopimelate desuccinylase
MDTIVKLAKDLIAIPSTKENPQALKDVLERALQEVSEYTIERFEKNGVPSALVYSGTTRPKRFKIILNAHLDVVPGREEQYKPFEKDGKLYGRGTDDMKAAAAVEILVFKELAKRVTYPLGLQLVTDEEVGGFNAAKHQAEQGVLCDFMIAGEPTSFGVNNKAKGIVWAKVTATGKTAHGAYPWNGESAVWKLTQFLNNLQQTYPVPKHEVWQTTVNVARVTTENQTMNKVPDKAEAGLDVRYIPEDSETIIASLNKLLVLGTALDIQLKEPSQFTDEKNNFVVKLREATQQVTGTLSEVIVKHGGSDVRHYNAAGCDGVTFGPIGAGLHTDEEWVDIQSLNTYLEILKKFLMAI